jgi:hypothetical protein
VAADDATKDEVMALMKTSKQTVLQSLPKELPGRSAICNGAVFVVIGGSLAAFPAGNFRGRHGTNVNYNQFNVTVDPFRYSCLENKSAAVHCTMDFSVTKHGQLSYAWHEFYRSSRPRLASSPLLTGPISFFVVGGLLDLERAWADDKSDEGLEVLMITWANKLYEQLLTLMDRYNTDVWYLGSGVQTTHPVFGKSIWLFNRTLTNRIRGDFPEPSTKSHRVMFADIYTPSGQYQEWLKTFKKRPKSKTSWEWKEEPKDVVSAFWESAKKLVITQCVASNDEQLNPAGQSKKVQRKQPGTPRKASRSPRKPRTPKKSQGNYLYCFNLFL